MGPQDCGHSPTHAPHTLLPRYPLSWSVSQSASPSLTYLPTYLAYLQACEYAKSSYYSPAHGENLWQYWFRQPGNLHA